MALYDPTQQANGAPMQANGGPLPNGPPTDQPPSEPPPEEGGQQLPQDPLNDPMAGGMVQASPEEQAQADQYVLRAWQLIYNDGTFQHVLDMLKGGADDQQGGDPIHGLAKATDMVVAQVGQAAEEAGQRLSPDAVFHASGDILEELAEVSRRAGIKDFAQDAKGLQAAWFDFLDLYRQRLDQAGVIDKQDAQNGVQQLMDADQSGTLDKIMRELDAADQSGQAGGEPQGDDTGGSEPPGDETEPGAMGPLPPPQQQEPQQRSRGFGAALGMR